MTSFDSLHAPQSIDALHRIQERGKALQLSTEEFGAVWKFVTRSEWFRSNRPAELAGYAESYLQVLNLKPEATCSLVEFIYKQFSERRTALNKGDTIQLPSDFFDGRVMWGILDPSIYPFVMRREKGWYHLFVNEVRPKQFNKLWLKTEEDNKWITGLSERAIRDLIRSGAECCIPIVEMTRAQMASILRNHYGLKKDHRDGKDRFDDPLAQAAGERVRRLKRVDLAMLLEDDSNGVLDCDRTMVLELELLSMDFCKNAHERKPACVLSSGAGAANDAEHKRGSEKNGAPGKGSSHRSAKVAQPSLRSARGRSRQRAHPVGIKDRRRKVS